MHGMLSLHISMRIRLLDALDEKKTLVKDVMTTFLDRDNWLKLKPFRSIYGDNNENKK